MNKRIFGVACGKTGFFGALLGRGDLPTVDANEINFWLCPVGMWDRPKMNCKEPVKSLFEGFSVDKKVCQIRDTLVKRFDAMKVPMPPRWKPFYQHLVHHAVFDSINQTKTTHRDMIGAMQRA